MKISLNTIKELLNFELPNIDELVSKINQQLGGVESIVNLGEKYKDVTVVRVVGCEKHNDSDHLHICKIDDGGVIKHVERDSDGFVQVVCGAPNAHEGMFAVWIPPKAIVPSTFDDAEPFVLDSRKLRGVVSNGMLAGGDEIAINDDHTGIVEIKKDDLHRSVNSAELKPGASFAKLFGLDDIIIEIENKMFTHRPDCFGQIGVAREIAGIFGKKFESHDWYLKDPIFEIADDVELEVFNDAKEKVSRFMAVAIKDVSIKQSPLWLQSDLVRWGGKPKNNVVDITNWIMLYTAQPVHAYDYDKIRGGKIGARMAYDGEEITLLNDKRYKLTANDIVIADAVGAIGIAGIMGGRDSEVSEDTKNIILEVATFDMYSLRKTAMRHGIFTDSLTRFNKGQNPIQNDRIIAKMVQIMTNLLGAKQASRVYDEKIFVDKFDDYFNGRYETDHLLIDRDFINKRLGSDLSVDKIIELLSNVEISLINDGDSLRITVPFWRTDLEFSEDIVEEIGRLYGFDNLPIKLPKREISPAKRNNFRELKQSIRESLARSGANEILTYSFVHENLFKKAEIDVNCAYKLSNALSPDLQYYRTNVLPSLLDKVHMNIKLGYDEFVLFEIGKGHDNRLSPDSDGIPIDRNFVDGVYSCKTDKEGAPYYRMRRIVEEIFIDLGILVEFIPVDDDHLIAPFDTKRTAQIMYNGINFGVVGEFKRSVKKNFKLPNYTAGFSIDLDLLSKNFMEINNYRPLSRFPSVTQDISLKASVNVSYAELLDIVRRGSKYDDLVVDIVPLTIYQSLEDKMTCTTTFRLTFTDYNRTLTDKDINPIMDKIASLAAKEKM